MAPAMAPPLVEDFVAAEEAPAEADARELVVWEEEEAAELTARDEATTAAAEVVRAVVRAVVVREVVMARAEVVVARTRAVVVVCTKWTI